MFYAAVNAAALFLDIMWTLASPLFGRPKHTVFTQRKPAIQITPPPTEGVLNAQPETVKSPLPLKEVKKGENGFSDGVIRDVTTITPTGTTPPTTEVEE